ncbi:MAG: hypothetical protein E7641_07745 [Ruminococcaceae bacterium]|nr:hypothetical protein [Oscillospiraceae bacterium]
MDRTFKTQRLTTSAVMLALSVTLAAVCALIPFLNLPFGGSFTIASMLPVVIVSYMYGIKWGFFTSITYSVLQMLMDLMLGTSSSVIMAMFIPSSDGYMGSLAGVFIILIDYFIAYSVLGIGGIFRKRVKNPALALCLGSVLALSLRFIAHIVSGTIFYGAWAEWFFSQEGFYKIGGFILEHFSGFSLSLIYSVFYNGLFMIPEIIITAVAAVIVSRIPYISKTESEKI